MLILIQFFIEPSSNNKLPGADLDIVSTPNQDIA